jgi:hypothetical protein
MARFTFMHENQPVTCWPKGNGDSQRVWVFRWNGRLFSTGLEDQPGLAAARIAQVAIATIEAERTSEPTTEPVARRRTRKAPKPAQRPASIGEGEVTYPEYVRAIQERRLDSLERDPAVCPGCGQRVPSGIIIFLAKARYCPACVPMMRRCVSCERMRPVTEFDTVITGKQRVESDCKDCRNRYQLARYHQAMAATPPPAGTALCASCGKTKPVGEFYRNPLYAQGVYSDCIQCKNAKWYAYREGRGSSTVEAVQQSYRRRRRGS